MDLIYFRLPFLADSIKETLIWFKSANRGWAFQEHLCADVTSQHFFFSLKPNFLQSFLTLPGDLLLIISWLMVGLFGLNDRKLWKMSVSVIQGQDDGHKCLDLFTFHRFSLLLREEWRHQKNIHIWRARIWGFWLFLPKNWLKLIDGSNRPTIIVDNLPWIISVLVKSFSEPKVTSSNSRFSFTVMYNNDKHWILTLRWNQHLIEKSLKKNSYQHILLLIDLWIIQLIAAALLCTYSIQGQYLQKQQYFIFLSTPVDVLKQLLVFFNKESN